MQPNFWDADYNLGAALLGKGQVDEAIFIRQGGQDAETIRMSGLANALVQKRRIDDAIVHYQSVAAIRPDYIFARYGLAHALLRVGSWMLHRVFRFRQKLIQPNAGLPRSWPSL
jgi:hypothetical protein